MPTLPKHPLPSGFQLFCMHFSPSNACYLLRPSHPSWFQHINSIWCRVATNCETPLWTPCRSILLVRSKYCPQHAVVRRPDLCSLHTTSDHLLHTYETTVINKLVLKNSEIATRYSINTQSKIAFCCNQLVNSMLFSLNNLITIAVLFIYMNKESISLELCLYNMIPMFLFNFPFILTGHSHTTCYFSNLMTDISGHSYRRLSSWNM
jgi:hypothetical protein